MDEGNNMAIKQINLSWIIVSDIHRSREFFKNTLGLNLNEFSDTVGWAELQGRCGGSLIGLAQYDAQYASKAGSNAVITFTVDNIEKTIEELKEKGVVFIGDIITIPNGPKMISFNDPDGNHFQLVEEMECESHTK